MRRVIYLLALVVVFAIATIARDGRIEAQGSTCLVSTTEGNAQGLDRGGSCAFLGIPFAAPPLGSLRWKAPQPAAPWPAGGLLATTAPPTCAQLNVATGLPSGSEDCLKLNVWTPNPLPSSSAPVILWLHPGSFANASANFAPQNGEALAASTGAIVVAPNYRLGPFGFLGHQALSTEGKVAGNYGFLDQRAALIWVRDHIAAFGGDPDNVTLAGQSAGAHSVGLHLVSPGSTGLFHRAIMQSGYASVRWRDQVDAQLQGEQFAAALGCTSADPAVLLACLRAKSQNQILTARPPALFEQVSETERTQWTPIVDGVDIPDQPRYLFELGAFNQVPVILGANRDEGWTFAQRSFPVSVTLDQYAAALDAEFGTDAGAVLDAYPAADFTTPKDALAAVVGDAEYVCEARRVARLIEGTKTPVFLYLFQYEVDPVSLDHVAHGLELNFVFGNNYGPPLFPAYALSPSDRELFHAMSGYWTRFATTGNPNSDDPSVVHWPAFSRPAGEGRGVDKFLAFDLPIQDGPRLHESACDFWESSFYRSATGSVPAATP
jgi:para-nitrobenzyl esterase